MGKVHLITGYAGEEHIHSADQGSFNASFFGGGEFVMEAGNQLEASIMDNNTVRILDGDLLMQGRHIRIDVDTYEDITITTGTAGVNRNDLIVMQYSKDTSTDIETAELVVVKGTEAEGTASDPEYTSGDILSGATFNQMPLYRAKVEGVVLTAVEPLFTTIPTYKKLAEQAAKQFKEACDTHLGSLKILDTLEEVSANTQKNQLAGALALKEMNNTLIASDGTHFKFGYNAETNEYGYIVTDSEGADTFCPFSNAKALYEALQYSGLVTEDMTYKEMLEVLSGAFGEKFSLIREGWTFSTNATEYDCTIIANDEQVSLTMNSFAPTNTNIVMYYRSPEFYADRFNYLETLGTTYRVTGNIQEYYNPIIYLVNAETGSKTGLHNHAISSYATKTLRSVNVIKNISSLTGRYYIEYYLGFYTSSGESGTYINLSKAELRA